MTEAMARLDQVPSSARSVHRAWPYVRAALLLGLVMYGYHLATRSNPAPTWSAWLLPLLRAEINAFAVVACFVVADRVTGGDGTRRGPYLAAIVAAASLGVIVAWTISHLGRLGLPVSNRLLWVLYLEIEYAVIAGAAVFAYLDHRRARAALARMHAAETARVATAKRTLETRLQAMQARVEPQFLFDTLGKVKRLYERNGELAERVLDELIAYLRAAMPRMRDTSSTVAQEVDLVRAWLSIARTGADAPFDFSIDVSEGARDARLPPMMLLPLTERMLAGSTATRFALSIVSAADRLRARIAADHRSAIDDDGTIAALRERLAALFGDQATLAISVRPDGGGEALLDIPFEPTGFEPASPALA